jgi:hypothetical protein
VGEHEREVSAYSERLKRWVRRDVFCHGSGMHPIVRRAA